MNPDTIKQYIQAIIDGLTPLAEKMSVPVTNLWIWALKHNYAMAVLDLVPIPLLIISSILLWSFSKRAKWDHSGYSTSGNGYAILQIIFAFVTAIAAIATVVGIFSAVPRIVAPEYSTAHDLVCLVKNCDSGN